MINHDGVRKFRFVLTSILVSVFILGVIFGSGFFQFISTALLLIGTLFVLIGLFIDDDLVGNIIETFKLFESNPEVDKKKSKSVKKKGVLDD